jgi:uncharacterized damage-inducible protein DinB
MTFNINPSSALARGFAPLRPGADGATIYAMIRDLSESIFAAWATSNRSTVYLIEGLPRALWNATIPAIPRRTFRTIAAHLHNSRCSWIRTLGLESGIPVPDRVDLRLASRRAVISALGRSSRGIAALLRKAVAAGGVLPAPKAYVWRNLPLDAGHILAYFVAHEGHHRGQIIMAARQLGMRVPQEVLNGVWHWTTRAREASRQES